MRLGLSVREQHPSLTDFVAVGEGGIDLLARVPRLPRFEEKVSISNRRELPGGQAATAAVAAARLGWRSRWIGATGDDAWGRLLRDALQREGVDVAAPVRRGAATRSAMVFVEETSGRRAVVESRDAALDVQPIEFAESTLCSGRITLVDGTNLPLSLHVARAARRAGSRTLVDLDRRDPRGIELLGEIDVVILPESLAVDLGGKSEAGAALAQLGKALPGAAAVIATLGERGALGWCLGEEVHVRAPAVSVVDTTGAGDAFRAGFAARWLASAGTNPDFPDLIEYAALVAALACRGAGAQTALPTAAEVAAGRSARV